VICRSNKEKKNGRNKDRRRRAGSEWKKKQAKGQGRILNQERKMTLCVVGKKTEGQVGG
jgi:hypothetical protein